MVMGVVGGTSRIPVVIGGAEAQSIALELENMKSSRPLTHDMYKSTLVAFGMKVDEVLVYKFDEGIFYAKVIVSNGDTIEEIREKATAHFSTQNRVVTKEDYEYEDYWEFENEYS